MRAASQILNESFLDVRAKLLQVAATLDRIDRSADAEIDRSADAEGPLSSAAQSQREQVDAAIEILLSGGADRAERLQRLFSRDYDSSWRQDMNL